jgi:hypothetical protein
LKIRIILAAALLAALPARALEVGSAPPEDFITRSRLEPGRLYALVIGATWCHACTLLAGGLAALDASSATAIGRASWNRVEVDEYGSAKFSKLLSEMQVPQSQDMPSVLVLRDGDGLGMSLAGNSLPKIEAFLAEAERQPSRYARAPAKSSMLCPGKSDWASYTLGISGYKAAEDASTDDFGRKILLSFVRPDAAAPGRLFAPPRSKSAPGTESARAEDGIFFSASDPLAVRATLLEDVSRSTPALAALASAPGRDLRLVLTGHSGEEGMTIAYETAAWFDDDPTNTYEKGIQLTPQDVADAVGRASRAGKSVRGMITTCYAGRYGDAFMPAADSAAAPSCAAFATLPDKTADGCYSNGFALGVDYASKLVARKSCASSEDGRALHYAVAASTTGHDIPMLSSEYFLLYGPGARFLGRGERAPAPPLSVQKFELTSDVRVYVDVVSNQVLSAFQGDRAIDPPRLAMLDCVGDDYSHAKLDRKNLSAFYLRPHKNASLVTQCTPFVSLYWESDGGAARPSTSVFLGPEYNGWDPGDDWNGFRKDFDTPGPMITMEGMRPAARVLLMSVIPAFSDSGASKDLGERLDRIVEDLRPYDEPLAGALQALMAAQAGGVKRAPPEEKRQEKSVDSLPGLIKALSLGEDALPVALPSMAIALSAPLLSASRAEALKFPSRPAAVDASALIAAMLDNLAPEKDEFEAALPRLAHLAAAAQAELSLIEEAKTSPAARRLLVQLETIKVCEQGLY